MGPLGFVVCTTLCAPVLISLPSRQSRPLRWSCPWTKDARIYTFVCKLDDPLYWFTWSDQFLMWFHANTFSSVLAPVCVNVDERLIFMPVWRPTNRHVTASFLRWFCKLTVCLSASMHANFSPLSVDLLGRRLMSIQRSFVTCLCAWFCRSDVAFDSFSDFFSEPHLRIFELAINGHQSSFQPNVSQVVSLVRLHLRYYASVRPSLTQSAFVRPRAPFRRTLLLPCNLDAQHRWDDNWYH